MLRAQYRHLDDAFVLYLLRDTDLRWVICTCRTLVNTVALVIAAWRITTQDIVSRILPVFSFFAITLWASSTLSSGYVAYTMGLSFPLSNSPRHFSLNSCTSRAVRVAEHACVCVTYAL